MERKIAFGTALLTAAIVFIMTSSAAGDVIYVKWDSPGPTFDGASWATAYHAVQAGLDAATSGDEVWVAAGTYVENITLKDGVGLYGGFAGTETTRDQRDSNANVTVLDGNQAGSVVTVLDCASTSTVIDSFTIRNGTGTADEDGYLWGGGVHCYGSSPTIANNNITGNLADLGGAIHCRSSAATITNNSITRNSARWGAGICCRDSSATITNNTIAHNNDPSYWGSGGGITCDQSALVIASNVIGWNSAALGGGIECNRSTVTITGNTIIGNSATHVDGGGIVCVISSVTITNNVIVGNGASSGGGIQCLYGTPVIIANNTITGNSASWGGGIASRCGASPTLLNNLVAFNSSGVYQHEGRPTLRNNCVYGNTECNYAGLPDPTGTDGNISEDPKLASVEYGNVHMQPDSPCIDAGDDSVVEPGWSDIDGQPRIQGAHVDIGADESDGRLHPQGPYVIVRVSPDGDDANDGSSWALAKRTVQAGIDAACAQGGEAWVSARLYYERIILRPYTYLYGGFAGTETVREERNWTSNITILDGEQDGSVVTAQAGEDCSAVDGFTIRNGNGTVLSQRRHGGGIYCHSSSPTITNNTIKGNSADHGAGILCRFSRPTITNNTIIGNSAYSCGGGIDSYYWSSPRIANNTIARNTASWGGGINHYGSSFAAITNNTIVGNTAARGGGISHCFSAITANNVVAFNSSGIYRYYGVATLRNNCVYGNTEYDYDGLDPGIGDISLDPLFVDLAGGDYHLLPDSPCIDAGTEEDAPSTDMDGNPRPVDGDCDGFAVTDIGAYEYQPIHVQVDVLPRNDANVLRLRGNRLIPVAILSDAVFDARWIDPMSVVFGPGRATEVHRRGHWDDVNRDRLVDLLLHFSCGASGIAPGDEVVTLYGRLINGERITGSDGIRVIARCGIPSGSGTVRRRDSLRCAVRSRKGYQI